MRCAARACTVTAMLTTVSGGGAGDGDADADADAIGEGDTGPAGEPDAEALAEGAGDGDPLSGGGHCTSAIDGSPPAAMLAVPPLSGESGAI